MGSFRVFCVRQDWRGGKLGSFRKKQLLAVGDWLLAGLELGSFRIIGVPPGVEIGFVSPNWGARETKLGSFFHLGVALGDPRLKDRG